MSLNLLLLVVWAGDTKIHTKLVPCDAWESQEQEVTRELSGNSRDIATQLLKTWLCWGVCPLHPSIYYTTFHNTGGTLFHNHLQGKQTMFPLRTEPLTQSFVYVATLTTDKQRKFIDKKIKMTKHLAFFCMFQIKCRQHYVPITLHQWNACVVEGLMWLTIMLFNKWYATAEHFHLAGN